MCIMTVSAVGLGLIASASAVGLGRIASSQQASNLTASPPPPGYNADAFGLLTLLLYTLAFVFSLVLAVVLLCAVAHAILHGVVYLGGKLCPLFMSQRYLQLPRRGQFTAVNLVDPEGGGGDSRGVSGSSVLVEENRKLDLSDCEDLRDPQSQSQETETEAGDRRANEVKGLLLQ
jgi:hypothetical protein